MNHFDPELDDEIRQARERFIEHREKQLQAATAEAADSAIKYLFTVNAGGAIAVLTYLGAISKGPDVALSLKIALMLFFAGVVIVGIYKAFVVHIRSGIFFHFQRITKQYFNEQKDWDIYFAEMEARVKPNILPYVIGYSSFACFLSGFVFGVVGML